MRRIVRPFVKEFKSRSSAKTAGRAILAEEAGAAPEPFFQSFSAPLIDERPRDDNYEAAMKAADLVFGRKAEAEPVEAVAAPPAAAGRVLPSLIEPFAALRDPEPLPLRRGPGRPRRIEPETQEAPPPASEARKARPRRARPEAPELSPATAAAARPIASAPLASPSLPLVAAAREDDAGAAPRRTRRPIQTRWVLKTALMAGERWKRRLPETAR